MLVVALNGYKHSDMIIIMI